MKDFDSYVRRVFFGTVSLILVFGGIFLIAGRPSWARGVVLGGAASLINLVLMAGDVRRQGATVTEKGVRPAYGRYALRMATMAGVLIYSATSTRVALWATIPALFTTQATMTLGEMLRGKEQGTS